MDDDYKELVKIEAAEAAQERDNGIVKMLFEIIIFLIVIGLLMVSAGFLVGCTAMPESIKHCISADTNHSCAIIDLPSLTVA